MPPRKIQFSKLFFKSLAGLGVGIIGVLILLIIIGATSGLIGGASSQATSPFLKFTILAVTFATAIVTNGLAVFSYGFIDREKYPSVRWPLRQILLLNILIFVLLLPIYLLALATTETLLTIAIFQIFLAAQASIFTLEISAARDSTDSMLAVYSVTFSVLFAVVLEILIFKKLGATAALMTTLPLIWLSMGIVGGCTEMLVRWIYVTWGTEFLKQKDDE